MFRRYKSLGLEDQVLDREHVPRCVDVPILRVAAAARERPLGEADRVLLPAPGAPLSRGYPPVEDHRLGQSLQLRLDQPEAGVLDLPAEAFPLPPREVLILDGYEAVGLQPGDYLVCLVLLPVRELLVLPPNQPDCPVSVVRSPGPSRKLPLEPLEPIAFSDRHVELLALARRYARLDPEVEAYFLSVLLRFLDFPLVRECHDIQVVAVGTSHQVGVREVVYVPELADAPDQDGAGDSLYPDLVLGLEAVCLAVLLQGDAGQFGLEVQASVLLLLLPD